MYKRARAKTTEGKPVTFDTPNGTATIDVPENSFYYRLLSGNDRFEYPLLCELVDKLGENTVFFDVGAHFGTMSKAAVMAGVPGTNIHAFEADDFVISVARENLQKHKVNVIHGWVGDGKDGTFRLDDYATTLPDVVKIDVEGAEARVLAGMPQILEQDEVTLFVEIHPQFLDEFGDNVSAVLDSLDDFRIDRMNDHRGDSIDWVSHDGAPTEQTYLIRAMPG